MFSKAIIASSLLAAALTAADSFEDFKRSTESSFKAEEQKFSTYKHDTEAAFQAYQEEIETAYKNYKKELSGYWEKPQLSTKKKWVSYTPDKKTRSTVDFAAQEIVIETISSNPKAARVNIENALRRTVTIDTKKAFEHDPLEQRILKIKLPQNVVTQPLTSEPVLSNVIFDKKPARDAVNRYVSEEFKKNKITYKPSKKQKHQQVYKLHVKLPPDTVHKRSKSYQKSVVNNASRFNLPAPLVYAVIHTESSYNPFARSHIPAYGLMQIVPKSAGIDTYYFLHKKKRLVSAQYLYNSENNIEMGSGYLHILYNNYLKGIKNPNSRLLCSIAAYNTGAGNIAYAFSGTYNVQKALPKINAMTADEVYKHLLKHLRHDEPKVYLQRVTKRMVTYHRMYGERGDR